MTERDLFLSALDLPAADRPAYLDRACAGNPDLRHKVDGLLAAHAEAGSFMEPDPHPGSHAPRGNPGPDAPRRPEDEGREASETRSHAGHGNEGDALPATSDLPADPDRTSLHSPVPDAGTVLGGKYKLVEPIGEGGMGTVWMAQQTEPVRRVVAVKLIKAGMDSRAVLARFEAERQALAMMDHPNIAKVLDAGATPDGRPYFVMELVKGVPITAFCDARKLTPRQRLELFVPVCQAVQHAHQKGVIHRDIKPSNVLVALYDDRPVPKVIDFGVAKAAGSPLTDHTLLTGFGAVVGTPEYMSPEQASFNQLDVDTRSDVYSLGVLLYELLAGSPPFRRRELEKAGVLEIFRVIREVEPPRPSHRLSTADALPSIAANRGTEPRHLTRLVRGELDWIVMRALEKDRARRYETANGLAADVGRYLVGEPVQAVPPSVGYRVQKFVRRNRAAVLVAAGFLLLAGAGAGGITLAYLRALDAEADARDKARIAGEEKVLADAARKQAERTAASLEVDVILATYQHGLAVGLLRLADTHKRLPVDLQHLREFTALAVLSGGQVFAPLLTPLSHDGYPIVESHTVRGNRTMLTLGGDETIRLWDVLSARTLTTLSYGTEQLVSCGLSQDGRTAYVETADGVVRFWDVPAGTLRAQTEPRPWRYGWRRAPRRQRDGEEWATSIDSHVLVGNSRMLTSNSGHFNGQCTELWDTQSGKLVHRYADDTESASAFTSDHWLYTWNSTMTALVIFSPVDGRRLAQLEAVQKGLHVGYSTGFPNISPTGRWIIIPCHNLKLMRVYDASTWKPDPALDPIPYTGGGHPEIRYLTDDTFIVDAADSEGKLYQHGRGQIASFSSIGTRFVELDATGQFIRCGLDDLYDKKSGRQLLPPRGSNHHPELVRFARDGRFVEGRIDLKTGKSLPPSRFTDPSYYPDIGFVSVHHSGQVYLLPTHRSGIAPDLLELWAQVVVRGELGPGGEFVKWDEPTWERKRQELAARPAPWPDFPFPGHVAADRLHWLRREWIEASAAGKPRLVAELLRRAEALGDTSEATRWRLELDRLGPHVAPPPREVRR